MSSAVTMRMAALTPFAAATGEPRGVSRRRRSRRSASLAFSVSISRRSARDVGLAHAARARRYLRLPQPGRDAADDDAEDRPARRSARTAACVTDSAGCGGVERIERHRDDLAVRDREHQDHDRERNEDEPDDELAEHWTSDAAIACASRAAGRTSRTIVRIRRRRIARQRGRRLSAPSSLFSRSRISLPVLKNGTDFFVDRDMLAGARIAPGARRPVLHRERAEAAQFDPVAARQRRRDLVRGSR